MAARGLVALFDENFSHRLIEFVAKESPYELQHVRKLGWSGRPDREWVPLASQQNFVIVTADRNQRVREFTSDDLEAMGARVLFLGGFWDHMDRWSKAKWIVSQLDNLVEHFGGLGSGRCLLISRNGLAVRI